MGTEQRVAAFLHDLAELTRRHGIAVDGGGYIHAPILRHCTDGETEEGAYRVKEDTNWTDVAVIGADLEYLPTEKNRAHQWCERFDWTFEQMYEPQIGHLEMHYRDENGDYQEMSWPPPPESRRKEWGRE